MSSGQSLALRMFGRPRGLLGRLGGLVMARVNRRPAAWVIGLLELRASDAVLELGFGPSVAVELLARSSRYVAGIDPSPEMLRQARRRNAAAIQAGRVDLRQASADHLPFAAESFDAALAFNAMQVWPDRAAGLGEMRRVLRPGGRAALVFTIRSGQRRQGTPELAAAVGFTNGRLIATDQACCLLATR